MVTKRRKETESQLEGCECSEKVQLLIKKKKKYGRKQTEYISINEGQKRNAAKISGKG